VKWSKNKLVGWVCLAVALGILLYNLLGRERSDGGKSVGGGIPVTKPFLRDGSRLREGSEVKTNPREEFGAARKRGMTEQEVRWIVEDFRNLGIDSGEIAAGSAEAYYGIRMRRHQWLLDALKSGFGLSKEQKSQTVESLEVLGARDLAGFTKYLTEIKSFEVEGKEYRVIDGSKVRSLTDSHNWLKGPDYAPWNLCDLKESQKDMVRFRNEEGRWIWIREGSRTLDFGMTEKYEASSDAFMTDPVIMNGGGYFFPLSMGQVEGMIGAKLHQASKAPEGKGKVERLALVRFLTTPQLKTLLLFEPEMAEQLMKELGE